MNTFTGPWLGAVTLAQGSPELQKAPEAWTLGDLTAWLSKAMPRLEVRPDCVDRIPEGFLEQLHARTFKSFSSIPEFPFFPANISTEEGDYIRALHACFFIEPILDEVTGEIFQEINEYSTPLPAADPDAGAGSDLLLIGGLGAGAILLAVALGALGA